jgi:HlyD family secretion protein
VLIPAAAVFATHEGMGAFRIREGRAELVGVTTGIQGDDCYEVLSGVEPGDEVILRPPRDIEPGARVVPE